MLAMAATHTLTPFSTRTRLWWWNGMQDECIRPPCGASFFVLMARLSATREAQNDAHMRLFLPCGHSCTQRDVKQAHARAWEKQYVAHT